MSGLTVKHKIEDVNEDGIELVLADVSILEDHQDVLYNPGISDRRKAENNQRIRKIARTKGYVHSYDTEEPDGILSKYDTVKEEIGFQLNSNDTINTQPTKDTLSAVPKSSNTKLLNPSLPKKRMRIVDILEGESRTENYEKYTKKLPKVPKFEEDTEYIELESQLNLQKDYKPNLSTQVSETGIEYTGLNEILINPSNSILDPKLSLKDTGSTSVALVPLPTERLQGTKDILNTTDDWITKEKPYGRGLVACLNTLRAKKELGNAKIIGRNKDKLGNEDILHYDSKGRLLTKKQAFRQQCYTYHNQKPSHSKTKKFKDKEEAALKQLKLDPSQGPESFKVTKDIMQKTKNPYVVLSNL